MAFYVRYPIGRIRMLGRRCYTAESKPFDSIPSPKGLPLVTFKIAQLFQISFN